MSNSKPKWNKKAMDIDVQLHGHAIGKKTTLRFEPHELMVDEDYIVRFMSIKLEDKAEVEYMNANLVPNDIPLKERLEAAHTWLFRFGISFLGGKIFFGKQKIVSISKFLSTTVASEVLSDFIGVAITNRSSYYEVKTGERVIDGPIDLSLYAGLNSYWT